MKKRILSIALALVMVISLIPAAALAAEAPAADTYVAEPVFVLDDTAQIRTAGAAGGMSRALENGMVALREGNYVEWIDRLDLADADFAAAFYNEMEEASDGDGIKDWLIDPTAANGATDLGGGVLAVKFAETVETLTDSETLTATQTITDGDRETAVEAAKQQLTDQITAAVDARSESWHNEEIIPYVYSIYTAFLIDHPEVFWMGTSFSPKKSYELGGYTVTIDDSVPDQVTASVQGGTVGYELVTWYVLQEPGFDCRGIESYEDAAAIKEAMNLLETRTNEIYSPEVQAMSRVGQIRHFNNWLTTHNEYYTGALDGNRPFSCNDPMTALMGGTGENGPVCESYARAFTILCSKAGIPCVDVIGEAGSGTARALHQWNYVQLEDGRWYAVDVTWNDPSDPGDPAPVSGKESENYLLVGAETDIPEGSFIESHPAENLLFPNATAFTNGPQIEPHGYFEVGITAVTLDDTSVRQSYAVGDAVPTVTVDQIVLADAEAAVPELSVDTYTEPENDDNVFEESSTQLNLILFAPGGYYFADDIAAPEGWEKNSEASDGAALKLFREVSVRSLSAAVTVTGSDSGTDTHTYGETLTFGVSGLKKGDAPLSDGKLEVRAGETVICQDEDISDGISLLCDTAQKHLVIGENELSLYYTAAGEGDAQPVAAPDFTVMLEQAPLTAAFSSASKLYDGTAVFSDAPIVFTGLASGDTADSPAASGALSGADAGAQSAVSVSGIRSGLAAEAAPYYALPDAIGGTLTIEKAAITAAAKNQSIYVGGAAPDLSDPKLNTHYTVSGLAAGDTLGGSLKMEYRADGTATTPDTGTTGSYEIAIFGAEVPDNSNYSGIIFTNGTLTVSARPSGGGGSSSGGSDGSGSSAAEEVTVPISSEEASIHVGALVSGGKAVIDAVDLSRLEAVIGDELDNVGTVTIDFSNLDSTEPITTVELPADVVKQIADAVADPRNDAESLLIILSDGTSIEFDAKALSEKAAQADGLDITISIESIKGTQPNRKQREAINGRPAYEISVTSGGRHIDYMSGMITVHAPYALQDGEHARGIVVWYVDEDGGKERCETSYDAKNQRVSFKTNHLSLYMVGYDKSLINPFTDISEDTYYYEAVLWALDNSVTQGTSETAFSPGAPCTRAQMAAFLYRTAQANGGGLDGDWMFKLPFTDVPGEYYEAIAWCYMNGITNGTGETTFSPDEPCTRAQMAVFIYRYEQANGGGFTGAWMFPLPFTDTPEWAYEAIAWCYKEGITQGTGAATFSPDADCTRAQMVTFLYRYFVL